MWINDQLLERRSLLCITHRPCTVLKHNVHCSAARLQDVDTPYRGLSPGEAAAMSAARAAQTHGGAQSERALSSPCGWRGAAAATFVMAGDSVRGPGDKCTAATTAAASGDCVRCVWQFGVAALQCEATR